MSVRQIYETAFDSKVKPENADYLDDLVQSPLVCSSLDPEAGTTVTSATSRSNAASECPRNGRDGPGCSTNERPWPERTGTNSLSSTENPEQCRIREVRKLESSMNSINARRIPGRFSQSYSMPKCLNEAHRYRRYHTEESLQAAASISGSSPPVRPQSDPLDRRKRDSSVQGRSECSSSRVLRLPLEQCNNRNEITSKTFSPSAEFKKLGVEDEKEKLTARASSHERSPTKDGDAPGVSAASKEPFSAGSDKDVTDSTSDMQTEPSTAKISGYEPGDQNSVPRCSRDDMKRNHSEMSVARQKLHLDLSQPPKKPRHHFLNFWTPGHDAFHEMIDPNLELEKQGWYHGTINHKDAENALRFLQEGSFLVRCCAKSQKSYSLSIKSSNGVMHMKISQLSGGRYALKQQNQPFNSIPEMIHHFSMHPLPVYGLEHVILKSPVISQLL